MIMFMSLYVMSLLVWGSRHRRWRVPPMGLLVLLLCGGCGSRTMEEQTYLDAMEAERQMRDSIRHTLNGGREEDAAMEMVREYKAPDGDGSTRLWVQRQLDETQGDILFPRWQARRRGVSRYEVWFSYAVLGGSGSAERCGFAWMVDLSLKSVEGPKELTVRELGRDTSGHHRLQSDETPTVERLQD